MLYFNFDECFIFIWQDPQVAIPKGTLLSIVISTIVYILFIFVCGGTTLREASGNITDINPLDVFAISSNCTEIPCDWGLQNSFQVIEPTNHLTLRF